MAITFALASRTEYSLSYLLTQDGGAGGSVLIDAPQMRADLIAGSLGGPLLDFLNQFPRTTPPTTAAEAQRLFLEADPTTPDLRNIAHCRSWIQWLQGVADWQVDGVKTGTNTEIGLNVQSALVAATAVLYIQFSHTLTR